MRNNNVKRQLRRQETTSVCEDVCTYGEAADGWEEHLKVRACDELWVHAVGFVEQALAQRALVTTKPFRYTRQVPHRLHRCLRDVALARGPQHNTIRANATRFQRCLQLWQLNVRLCY